MFVKSIICFGVLFGAVVGINAQNAKKGWGDTPGLYAIFDTSSGKIVCRLFEKETPKTVENFLGLAEGTKEFIDPKTGQKTKKRFYDGLIFHRVIPNFMIQGGCPLGNGRGGPGYSFEDELVQNLKFDQPGRLAMANAGSNTNGSQFFITEAATPWLDGHHTIFGQVIEGQDVVHKIATSERGTQDKPVKDIKINRITIKRAVSQQNAGGENKMGKPSAKKILFIVAPTDFRDEEYFETKDVLSKEGIQVITASLNLGEIKGMLGGKAKSDLLLDNVKTSDYDAIAFIGGTGSQVYFDNVKAHSIAVEAVSQGKVLGAICVAPSTLGKAGILKGKKATSFSSQKNDLISAGADFTGKPVEQDGKIITASGPEAAKAFGKAIADALVK